MSEISDEELLRRGVAGSRNHWFSPGAGHARWTAVSEQFAVTAIYARALCLRFGVDPDEMVKR